MKKFQSLIMALALVVIGIASNSDTAVANYDGSYCKGGKAYITEQHSSSDNCVKAGTCKAGDHYSGSPHLCTPGKWYSCSKKINKNCRESQAKGWPVLTHHFVTQCPTNCVQPPPPKNGQCNSAYNGKVVATKPLRSQICTKGTPSQISGNGTAANKWRWSCGGQDGGSTPTCTATKKPVNGVCSPTYKDQKLDTKPSGALCTTGVKSTVTGSGTQADPWKWNCLGNNTGTDENGCQAWNNPVAGVCNSAVSRAYETKADLLSANNLCTEGTPPVKIDSITGTGVPSDPWAWTCSGIYGAGDGSCRALKKCPGNQVLDATGQCGCPDGTVQCGPNRCVPIIVTPGKSQLNSDPTQCPGGTTVGVDVSDDQCSASVYCKVYNTDTNLEIGSGPINGDGTITIKGKTFDPAKNADVCSITDHATDNIRVECSPDGAKGNDCGDGKKDSGEECDEGSDNGKKGSGCSDSCKEIKKVPATVQCVCTATRCSSAGTCEARPIIATQYNPSLCVNECTPGNNASCSGGGTREVTP